MTSPDHLPVPPSGEGIQHFVEEVVLAEDWDTRFTANGAGMRAINAELAATQDPDRVLELTEMKGEALVRTLGSGVLGLFKRDVLAEREAFDTQFGE